MSLPPPRGDRARLILSSTVALMVCGVLAPARARAQAPNNQISYSAVMKAPVGTWAEYLMTKDGEDESIRVRYTLVDRSAKHVVIELDSTTPIGRMIMRMEFLPQGTTATWKLTKAQMKLGDAEAREVPLPVGADGKGTTFGKTDSFGDKLAHEEITVKAGTFSADHYRRRIDSWTTELWMDDQALPIGMVKLNDGQGSHVELVDRGVGGKSAFAK